MDIREPDPVIAEVREARRRISERFGHDARRLVAHYILASAAPGGRPGEEQAGAAPDQPAGRSRDSAR